MIRRNSQLNRRIINNLLWFIASLGMAIFVWLIATTQSDPITSDIILRVPIIAEADEGYHILNIPESVNINVRAPESVFPLRTSEIIVTANLDGLGAGTHRDIELDVDIPQRRALGDAEPRVITVILEEIQSKLVEIEPLIEDNLPPDYERGAILLDDVEVEVTGASSLVERVVSAQIIVELEDQRTAFEGEFTIIPVDVDGNRVNDVEISQTITRATIMVSQSSDVRAISIIPDINADTLPDGYNFTSFDYEPQTLFVRGEIDELPDVLYTQPINLTNRTDDFEIRVPVIAPGSGFLVLGDRIVTVTVVIDPAIGSEQFDAIPLTIIGANNDYITEVATETVSVLITGPQVEIDALNIDDIRVVIDLTDLQAGTYEITPIVETGTADDRVDVSVSPASISITITELIEETLEPDIPDENE